MAELIEKAEQIKRVPLYIEGFDENVQGGIPTGFVSLVAGTSGTMKSSVSFNVLYNEVLNGKKGLYISLEQSSPSLLNHLVAMGFDISKINTIVLSDISKMDKAIAAIKAAQGGTLVMTDVGAMRKQLQDLKNINPDADWIFCLKNIVKAFKAESAVDVLVLDSLSALYALSQFKQPRTELFHFFEFMRDLDVTSLLVTEVVGDRIGEYGVEDYLSDGIFKLAMLRDGLKVRRELNVVKLRATDANMNIYILDYKNKKFRAMSKLPY